MEKIELGTCIKDSNKKVLYQDDLCINICGNMDGLICNKGCMASYAAVPGMTLIKNSSVENSIVDAVVINNGKTLTTLIYPPEVNEGKLENDKALLMSYGLSKSETTIFLLVMAGKKNGQIYKEMFISKATLKTHLNNIYKKLPESYQEYKNRR